jgi:hypothetical protein
MAPTGYLNDKNTGTIVIDEERFSLVRQMWELLITGAFSPRRILEIATHEWGFRTRKSKRTGGKPLSRSALYRIFTNPFYAGLIEWGGQVYEGKHPPMVTPDEFDRAQEVLGRNGRPRRQRHRFAFVGMIRCGECGLSVTAEEHVKKNGTRYSYYRCTKKKSGYRCSQRFVSAEEIDRQIAVFLRRLAIPRETADRALGKLQTELQPRVAAIAAQKSAREQALKSLERERATLLSLRLRELVSDAEFAAKRSELDRQILTMTRVLQDATQGSPLELLELVFAVSEAAAFLFENGDADLKRHIVETVGSNFSLRDRNLSISAAKPFREWSTKPNSSELLAVVDDVRTLSTDVTLRNRIAHLAKSVGVTRLASAA